MKILKLLEVYYIIISAIDWYINNVVFSSKNWYLEA